MYQLSVTTLVRLFVFVIVSLLPFHSLIAQCSVPDPDGEYCYGDNEVDVVAFEICPDPGETITAEICQGVFEACCDRLTVYEGASGSGTAGTVIFGPIGFDVSGTVLTTNDPDNCLIYIVNSDVSASCSDGSFVSLEVYINECPMLPDAEFSDCYGENEIDVVQFEVCPDMPTQRVGVEICTGSYESGIDSLKVFEGVSGSGITGDSLRYLTGDVSGISLEATTAGNCLIFATFSDASISCASGDQTELRLNSLVLLPAELLSFSGERYPSTAMLNWTTASELNTEWFIIERSVSGTDNWIEIGRVEAAGNSTEKVDYALEDDRPVQRAYYRLKTIDLDGYTEYSQLVRLEIELEEIIRVFPNPSDGLFKLGFESATSHDRYIDVYNVQGQLVFQRKITGSANEQMTIDLREVESGMYFLSIRSGDLRTVESLVVF